MVQWRLLHVVFCGSMATCLATFVWSWRCKAIGKGKPCYFPKYFSEVFLQSFAHIWPEQQEIEDKPSGPVYSYQRNILLTHEIAFIHESICKNTGDLQWILIVTPTASGLL